MLGSGGGLHFALKCEVWSETCFWKHVGDWGAWERLPISSMVALDSVVKLIPWLCCCRPWPCHSGHTQCSQCQVLPRLLQRPDQSKNKWEYLLLPTEHLSTPEHSPDGCWKQHSKRDEEGRFFAFLPGVASGGFHVEMKKGLEPSFCGRYLQTILFTQSEAKEAGGSYGSQSFSFHTHLCQLQHLWSSCVALIPSLCILLSDYIDLHYIYIAGASSSSDARHSQSRNQEIHWKCEIISEA